MGFDWGDETYKQRVYVVPLADGRYTWRLVTNDYRGTGTVESSEEGDQSFDNPEAAEEAGKKRMVELAQQGRSKTG